MTNPATHSAKPPWCLTSDVTTAPSGDLPASGAAGRLATAVVLSLPQRHRVGHRLILSQLLHESFDHGGKENLMRPELSDVHRRLERFELLLGEAKVDLRALGDT